jgi:hypothetical protein
VVNALAVWIIKISLAWNSVLPTIAIQIVSTRISECASPAIQICKNPVLLVFLLKKIQISRLIGAVNRITCKHYLHILSQNTKGFDNDKEEMVLAIMQQKNILAYAIQEIWKLGDGLYEKYGFLVIQHGSDIKNSRGHNSGVVAIILSPEARNAWVAAGSCVKQYGD